MSRVRHHFPFQPLLDVTGLSARRMAYLLEVDRAAVQHKIKQGWLSEPVADRWAQLLGFHPAEVWPELWWADVIPQDLPSTTGTSPYEKIG